MLLKKLMEKIGSPAASKALADFADLDRLGKATRFVERFREVVSDPVNLLIGRVPEAGFVDRSGCVVLHNGNRVPIRGPRSYYGVFSDILIINRGVHEPLEEYCFQEMLATDDRADPVMLELGAYWAHYSMWLKKARPRASCHLVEADAANLECGRANFQTNGYEGEFHLGMVGRGGFEVDAFVRSRGLSRIDILHADIQGFECEMLKGTAATLAAHKALRVFISTHSQQLHSAVEEGLRGHGYLIEVSSSFDSHTTSDDGFILASAPDLRPILSGWKPLGRLDILRASPATLADSILPRIGKPP